VVRDAAGGVGYRVGAALVDYALTIAVGGLAGAVDESAGVIAAIAFWLLDVVVIAAVTDGQTIGKRLAAIRTVRENGDRYGVGTALLRDVVCRLPYVIPLYWLTDVLIALGEEHQTLRDRMVSTRVVALPAYRARRRPLAAAAVVLPGPDPCRCRNRRRRPASTACSRTRRTPVPDGA
jgi:uncharacterized RDD family membrane protein YckC